MRERNKEKGGEGEGQRSASRELLLQERAVLKEPVGRRRLETRQQPRRVAFIPSDHLQLDSLKCGRPNMSSSVKRLPEHICGLLRMM